MKTPIITIWNGVQRIATQYSLLAGSLISEELSILCRPRPLRGRGFECLP